MVEQQKEQQRLSLLDWHCIPCHPLSVNACCIVVVFKKKKWREIGPLVVCWLGVGRLLRVVVLGFDG